MRCLVLGGAGFMGSHLCERLLKSGNEVLVYEQNSIDAQNLSHIVDKVKLIKGEYTQEDNWKYILKNVNVVFHLISTSVPKTSNESVERDLQNNAVASLRLLDGCVDAGVSQVIFFSSGGTVYGNIESSPIAENHPTNPICAYGVHKLLIEKYLYLYHHLHNLDYRVLRISNPYGYRQAPYKQQGVISTFMALSMEDKPVEIWGTGHVIRDFIHIDDVIDAVMKILNYNGEYRLFNVGYGVGASILDLIKDLSEVIGKDVPVIMRPSQSQDVEKNILDISRICSETGWKPKINLKEGLRRTYMQ